MMIAAPHAYADEAATTPAARVLQLGAENPRQLLASWLLTPAELNSATTAERQLQQLKTGSNAHQPSMRGAAEGVSTGHVSYGMHFECRDGNAEIRKL